MEPTQWRARQQLASMQLQRGDPGVAQALLSTSVSASDGVVTLRECLSLVALAEAQKRPIQAQRLAQKAVLLSPWSRQSWAALAYSRSCAVGTSEV